jgi:glucose/arabinose dehydrogenase
MLRRTYHKKAILGLALLAISWNPPLAEAQKKSKQGTKDATEYGPGADVQLVAPNATESARNRSEVIGWPAGRKPQAPAGFEVTLFADDLDTPRWAVSLPNGDILVALSVRGAGPAASETSNRIVLFRDKDGDGKPEFRSVLLKNLNRPHGILLLGDYLYVGNTDAVIRYTFQMGQTEITSEGEKILDLPPGGHYTRNLIASPDGKKIYVAVGSKSNVDVSGEDAKDPRRAAILEMNPDGTEMRVYASGLRNPVGMDWEPITKALWAVVNERDALGDQLVPDYATSVKDGAFYGWPYSYYGQNLDPRMKGQRPDLVAKAIPPDYATGAHTATLGITFYTGKQFPTKFHGGAFIGQHGSWNRSSFVGYRIAFLPFKNGKPSGAMEDFLTGFVANSTEVYGRPVVAALLQDGALLVVDDESSKLWHVRYTGK